jgi:methylated-DNA-[protein]-cysteine S-methyltransferase
VTAITYYRYVDSPLGRILLVGDGPFVTGVYLEEHKRGREPEAAWQKSKGDDVLAVAAEQLTDYFAGRRRTFDVPIKLQGTPFQQQVWRELVQIPHGQTISYAELARRVGNPAASRAVGSANGRNPISIIVPCHRVIGADGKLTGYAGGVDKKRRLLEWERGAAAGETEPLLAGNCAADR